MSPKIVIEVNPHGGWRITADDETSCLVCYALTLDQLLERVRDIASNHKVGP